MKLPGAEFGAEKIFGRGVVDATGIPLAQVVRMPEEERKVFVNIPVGNARQEETGIYRG